MVNIVVSSITTNVEIRLDDILENFTENRYLPSGCHDEVVVDTLVGDGGMGK